MHLPDTGLEILTFGRFSISVDGNPVATSWPNEAIKVFFCSLLSPLDLYFTYDRVCRSMLGVPATQTSRHQLVEEMIRPLNRFLIKELGFNPLIAGPENIRIDLQRIYLDALVFNRTALEGLRLMALGNHAAAIEKLKLADSIHTGIYLPEMPGKIVSSTRNELESLYLTTVMYTSRLSGLKSCSSGICGEAGVRRISRS